MNDFDVLITTTVIACVGVLMIILRRLKIGNEYVFDAAEWLIIGTMPLVVAAPLLKDDISRGIFIAVYAGIIVAWGIAWWVSKKANPEKEKKARPVFLILFLGMICFVILTYLRTIGKF